ncbi:MAG TPA: tRNA preQ1(34) S-adenosylmethionine ribosyltransferase-isomerase QueA [Proteobacteria bacterium]|nr:tRNA preQ1(34) S-adenosylmethionine ribosyltransferase-isomerase QueA [Pseudomonadota bacterium]
MDVALFDYELPSERIAQHPLPRRDQSRLLLVRRGVREFVDGGFTDLKAYLQAGDLLVLNDTRVIPARLLGRKESGGAIEAFLVRLEKSVVDGDESKQLWRVLFKASKKPRPGQKLDFGGLLRGMVVEASGAGPGLLLLSGANGRPVAEVLEQVGRVPLPPYIKRAVEDDDRRSYQTVFADPAAAGAVAAPTAGLHFTPELLRELGGNGVEIAFLTLHVGLGTFAPVRSRTVEGHRIHEEFFRIPPSTLERVAALRARGGRLVAVGSTVTRALEYHAATGLLEGLCDLFIYPGYEFKMVDAILTNFHLPASTLMMLVSAFAGRETVMAAYRRALELEYRFYSYGDAMLLLK